jgi:phage antirepressor YoqD-like protein
MDKRKVIAAYRRGLITVQECAQILGLDDVQLLAYMRESRMPQTSSKVRRSVRN